MKHYSTILLMLNLACSDITEHELLVSVKDHHSAPIEGAEVYIDSKLVGLTDSVGDLKAKIKTPEDQPQKLEILKTSDAYYYAPYTDQLDPKQIEVGSLFEVRAILYFIPKPNTPDTMEKIAEGSSPIKKAPQPFQNILINKEKKEIAIEKPIPKQLDQKRLDLSQSFQAALARTEYSPQNQISPEIISSLATIEEYPLYTFEGEAPLPNVDIKIATKKDSFFKYACRTNNYGKCQIPKDLVGLGGTNFLASKSGYLTKKLRVTLQPNKKLSINMTRGMSVDIFAETRIFDSQIGMANIGIFENDALIGVTDKLGFYSFQPKGSLGEFTSVKLQSKNLFPKVFITDLMISEHTSIQKNYTFETPPSLKVYLAPLIPNGMSQLDQKSQIIGKTRTALAAVFKKLSDQGQVFEMVPKSVIEKSLQSQNKSLSSLLKDGWKHTPLVQKVHAIVRPVLTLTEPVTLELTMINSSSKVDVARLMALPSQTSTNGLKPSLIELTKNAMSAAPLQGRIVDKKNNTITLNFGLNHRPNNLIGRKVSIFGLQTSPTGRKKYTSHIGNAEIKAVNEQTSTAIILSSSPRSLIAAGDLVHLRPLKVSAKKNIQFRVYSSADEKVRDAVAGANIYIDNNWVGSTDEKGLLSTSSIPGATKLTVMSTGFRKYEHNIDQNEPLETTIRLAKNETYLNIETIPSNAAVYVNDSYLGKTPLKHIFPGSKSSLEILIKGLSGYKSFSKIYSTSEGYIDLSGPKKISLERELLTSIRRLLDKGQVELALDKIKSVPRSHSDKTPAIRLAGFIYLNLLDQPAKAAYYYGIVTQSYKSNSVAKAAYISSLLDEAIAIFFTAEKFRANDVSLAKSHYKKSLEKLTQISKMKAASQKGKVSDNEIDLAYYDAMTSQRLFSLEATKPYQTASKLKQKWEVYLAIRTQKDSASDEYAQRDIEARKYLERLATNQETRMKL